MLKISGSEDCQGKVMRAGDKKKLTQRDKQ